MTLSAPASPAEAFSARGSGEVGAFTSPQSRGVRGGKLGAGTAPPATTQDYDMSTNYYGIRAPFTAIRIIAGPTSSVYPDIAGELAGEIRCAYSAISPVLLMFADRGTVLATRGGSGMVYADADLPDSLQLVSEYGDLTTLGEVRRGVAP